MASMKEYLDGRVHDGRVHAPAIARRNRVSFMEWVASHVSLNGARFSFSGHAYLHKLYLECHPDEVYMKAAQVCISTLMILQSLWKCDTEQRKCGFYLSTDNDAEDFANDRVNPIIEASEYLKGIVRTTRRRRDNVGLKHVGQGALYLRGVETRRNVKSVDLDMVILDELDEGNQKNIQFALDRMLHSDLHWVRRLSQPSIPDYGIAREFADTDQHFWHLRCPACGHRQCLELETEDRNGIPMPKNFMPIPAALRSRFPDEQTYYRGCISCGAPLDMERGEWVARHPERTRRGYHLSQLYTTVSSNDLAPEERIMEEILSARTAHQIVRVVNSIIGNAYSGDRQPLTEEIMSAAEHDAGFLHRSKYPCFMGIDTGNLFSVAICDAPEPGFLRVIRLAVLDDPDGLDELMLRYNVEMAVIDSMPEIHTARGFVGRHPGRAHLQRFTQAVWKIRDEDEDEDLVPEIQMERTLSLDDTCAAIKAAARFNREEYNEADTYIFLPRHDLLDAPDMQDYLDCRRHLSMLVKDMIEDARGRKRWDYKHNVENHFGMAINSARVAHRLSRITGGRDAVGRVQTSGVSYSMRRSSIWEGWN